MRVIEPHHLRHLKPRKKRLQRSLKWFFWLVFLALVVLGSLGYSRFRRPLPKLTPFATASSAPVLPKTVALPWPGYGQAAVGAQGLQVLATMRSTSSVPVASIAKVLTALVVLKKYPLVAGQQGPVITLSDQDVAFYDQYVSTDGSVVPVSSGEQITEYQVLQAMMLPSANNMADTLAHWAFGSVDAYVTAANDLVTSMGLSQTHIADASGFSSDTVSSAHDLILLGEAAFDYPALVEIMGQKSATIPVAGEIDNLDFLLGTDGVIGMKTGNTDQAGGCFLWASQQTLANGKKVAIIGAVLGAPTLSQVMRDSLALIRASRQSFTVVNVAQADQVVGTYSVPWGGTVNALTRSNVATLTWQGSPVTVQRPLDTIAVPKTTTDTIGAITGASPIDKSTSLVHLEKPIHEPGWRWRIFHR